jgi:hypothetical protein
MDSACGTYAGKEECMQSFGMRPEGNGNLEDPDVDGEY